jgi:splicing factor 3B subunit 3
VVIEKYGEVFKQQIIPLKYTPRKLLIHNNLLITIETDYNAYSESEIKDLKENKIEKKEKLDEDMEIDDKMEIDEKDEKMEIDGKNENVSCEEINLNNYDNENLNLGQLKRNSNSGRWASYIRVFDPISLKTLQLIELKNNEAAFSITNAKFSSKNNEEYIVVGCSKDFVLYPKKSKGIFLF